MPKKFCILFFTILIYQTPATAQSRKDVFLFEPAAPFSFGSLTVQEAKHIQATVNLLRTDLLVVGSTANGLRRNAGTDLPIGYGEGTKSDIDYVIPTHGEIDNTRAWAYILRSKELDELPGLGLHSVLATSPEASKHRIWFRPWQEPLWLRPGETNLMFAPFLLTHQ